jgi:GWxTD domain-containing protein
MKANRVLLSLAVLLSFVACASSAHSETEEPRKFRMGADYACFQDFQEPGDTYLEIYYSFNRKELQFVSQEEGLLATVLMQLSIVDQQGSEVESRMWNTMSKVNDAQEAQTVDYMILDRVTAEIPPGAYRINLKATDVNSLAEGEASVQAEVKQFSDRDLELSDVQLAFSIMADTTEGRFCKAGQRILPNPSGIFTHEGGMVYFYAELYNLKDSPGSDPDYELSFSVEDTSGKKVRDFGKQSKEKPGASAVVMSGINISTLAGGTYLLAVEAKDKETGKKALATKTFAVLREPTQDELAADEVKRFKQDVTYIATSAELKMFNDLNFVGKKTFMEEFWRRRDPNPETPENEFKIEHYRRINTADLKFSRTRESNDGWNTDMGRVYITYGEPEDIERHPSSQGTKPWERWNYHNLEGCVCFIYVDEDGYGVYRLVHSDKKGEISYPQWEDLLNDEESLMR